MHVQRTDDEINGPDEHGCFPDAALDSALPVVVDANVLRNDVLYACKREGVRTILVNGANAGLIRLFCASHVVGEVAEHYEDWSCQANVDPLQFEAVWAKCYIPLLRLVATVPTNLLSVAELDRIRVLVQIDPDDVPSVALALLLEGFYLSQDGPATTAVYGGQRDRDELARWRLALAAGGDAGMLRSMLDASVAAARLAHLGIGGTVSSVRRLPPWFQGALAIGVAGGGVYAATQLDAEPRQRLQGVATEMFRQLAAAAVVHHDAIGQMGRVRAPAPSIQVLKEELDASAFLTRAVLRQLSLSRRSHLSAEEIARVLPNLPVAHSEGCVRAALRSQTTAWQVERGRWQLGEPVTWPPTSPIRP